MTLHFKIQQAGRAPRTEMVTAGMSIGRSHENSVVIDDGKVGRKHLEVVDREGVLHLVQLKAKNGTRIVGGGALEEDSPLAVSHGLTIQLGDTTIEIGVDEPPPEQPSQTAPGEGTVQSPRRHPGAKRRPGKGAASVGGDLKDEGTMVQRKRPGRPAAKRSPPSGEPGAASNGDELKDEGTMVHRKRPGRPKLIAQEPPAASAPPAATPPAATPPAATPPAATPPAATPPAATPPAATPPADTPPTDEQTTTFAAGASDHEVHKHRPSLVIANPNIQRTVELKACPYTIGRSEDQSLYIPDNRISREHAVIDFVDDGFVIRDCGSKSGTVVDGSRLATDQTAKLDDETGFALGPLDFYFFFDTEEKRAANAKRHQAAVKQLAKANKISGSTARRIVSVAKKEQRQVAEVALREGDLSVADWQEGLANARSGLRGWLRRS